MTNDVIRKTTFVFILVMTTLDDNLCNCLRQRFQNTNHSLSKGRDCQKHGHRTPCPPPSPPLSPGEKNSTTFNVLDYGAVGDGNEDDTKALLTAWLAACNVEGSTVVVPSGLVFLVGPVSFFTGPNCKPRIVFQLDGTIIAPTGASAWGSGLLKWIEFTKLIRVTIQGSGVIDGRGSVWWTEDDWEISSEKPAKMPKIKPTALRFYGSIGVTVTGITIRNSPQTHLKFDSYTDVHVFAIRISSPETSPNTDGIHLQNSRNVLIHDTNLACGDDCVSIQTGCSNVFIRDVTCGPGHGISIGGLGGNNTKACVSNVTVRDISMTNTMTGVRIKTWQGGSGSVQDVFFSNIRMSAVRIPIMIDQFYCDKSKCRNQTSAVAISSIDYVNIHGTYTVQPVYFACSNSFPCEDISLVNIDLEFEDDSRRSQLDSFCWGAYGESTKYIPADCLLEGQPIKRYIRGCFLLILYAKRKQSLETLVVAAKAEFSPLLHLDL